MDWIEGFANELELEQLSKHEVDHLLTSARDVAHRIERKITPLAMYLVGVAVGRELANGRTRDEAIEDAIHTLLFRLPPAPEEGSNVPPPPQ
jgi:Domain of unknown function (DUF6457)